MRRLFRLVTLFAGLLPVCAAFAQPAPAASGIAFARLAHLQRGINLSGWFTWGDYSQQHLDTWITPADLRLIHEMGFDNVRIGIDPAFLTHGSLVPRPTSQSAQTEQALAQLDHAVSEALAAHLAVTLTVFPDDNYKHALAGGDSGIDDLVLLWRVLAHHLAAADPDRVFFELINEPEVSDPYRWMGIQARLAAAIRGIDQQHTLIATAASYSSLPDLLRLEPVRDPNIIYTFHFYEPYPFTHQGATWGSSDWVYYRDIPYPAPPQTLDRQMKAVPDDLARYNLYLYGAGAWSEQAFAQRLAFAAAWAQERGVPILCNEFGVYRDTADPASRARWIEDVRSALDQNHIPWAMWDYRGNFGIVIHTGSEITPDPAILRALGLNANVPPAALETPGPH